MARLARSATVGVRLALLAALLSVFAACRDEPRCAYCNMRVSAATRAVVVDDGERKVVCDPRCALTELKQTGRHIVLDEVADFDTGRTLVPAAAHYVTGSDVTPDVADARMRTWPTETAELHWHRCLPSILAFSSGEAAERFQREHGGSVIALGELADAAAQR